MPVFRGFRGIIASIEIMSARKRRATRRRFSRYFFIACVAVLAFFTVFWPSLRTLVLRALIPVGLPREGSLAVEVTGRGFVAAKEIVIRSPVTGVIRYLVRPGERVRAGAPLCVIESHETREILEKALLERKQELRAFEEAHAEAVQKAREDFAVAYGQAAEELMSCSLPRSPGELQACLEAEERVLRISRQMGALREFLETYEQKRVSMLKEIERLEEALAWAEVTVPAPEAGVFYPCVDGLEGSFPEDSLPSAADVRLLLEKSSRSEEKGPADGESVLAQQEIGKIVVEETVRLVFAVATEQKPAFRTGQDVLVRSAAGERRGTVGEIVDGNPPGYSVVTVYVSGLLGPDFVRSVDATIVLSSPRGLIIPVSALVRKNGATGVLTVYKTVARFEPVEVILIKGDQAVVRGISGNTQILMRAWGFLEGKRVR